MLYFLFKKTKQNKTKHYAEERLKKNKSLGSETRNCWSFPIFPTQAEHCAGQMGAQRPFLPFIETLNFFYLVLLPPLIPQTMGLSELKSLLQGFLWY